MHVMWIPDGEFGIGLAEGVAGMFKSAFFFDGTGMEDGELGFLAGQAERQACSLIAMVKSPLAMKKKFGGYAFMAYGSQAKPTEGVLIYKPGNTKDERGKALEFLHENLRLKKIVKGP